MKNQTYTIYAYRRLPNGHIDNANGAHYDTTEDTLADAKARARYVLTEEFRRSSEASERLGYARVENEAGECVYDCFAR